MSREPFTLIVTQSQNITHNVLQLTFKREDGEALAYIPGQFITIHFEHEGETLRRSYSIANPPRENAEIDIAAAHFPGGPGTEYLFSLKPGDKVTTTGPFGRLILREEQPKRYILVATGTGITPFCTMLPELARRIEEEGAHVDVLLGVQRRQDLLYGADLMRFAHAHTQFTFHACYSREESECEGDHECKGYVQTQLETLNVNPETDVVYLCGNPSMIDDVFNYLKEKAFSPAQIRREKYIS